MKIGKKQKMKQFHLFIIDPIENLNFKLDSSIRLAFELIQLGANVYSTEITDLFWNIRDACASCYANQIAFPDGTIESLSIVKKENFLLEKFNGIHMRKEPPFNISYISATWFLDSVRDRTKIYNDPAALRAINEKLSIFRFPEAVKDALVSCNVLDLYEFLETKANGDAILKPLDLFGGKGIIRLQLSLMSKEQALAILDDATNHSKSPRLIQPFDHRISDGEVRVFTFNGDAISWCLKKPREGHYMANTSEGARLLEYKPDHKMRSMVEEVAKALVDSGIYIAGFDIIGDAISEINVTSPRLLQAAEDQTNYYKEIAKKMCLETEIRS
ncbi:MAG: hypothetical protein R3B45_09075 [Bdellovibrionota bacterium]